MEILNSINEYKNFFSKMDLFRLMTVMDQVKAQVKGLVKDLVMKLTTKMKIFLLVPLLE